jgi:p-aminobenzoyl-glutamate transporter AbgT
LADHRAETAIADVSVVSRIDLAPAAASRFTATFFATSAAATAAPITIASIDAAAAGITAATAATAAATADVGYTSRWYLQYVREYCALAWVFAFQLMYCLYQLKK